MSWRSGSGLPRTRSIPLLDATSLLSLYAVLLIALPSKLIFAPLGGAGTPAQVVAVFAAFWYLWSRIQRPHTEWLERQSVRNATLSFAGALLASYIAATIRPITDGELSTADLGLISLIGWVGIVLVANEGITTVERLLVLLRRIAALGGALATLGVIQFVTGDSITDRIDIPGLTVNMAYSGVAEREGFNRIAGTATHPIEFGVVLCAILPIALTCAMSMRDRGFIRRWYPVAAIATAIPLSISRSAIIGSLVVLALLMPFWTRSQRRVALVGIVVALAAFFAAIPGFLGALSGLFTGIGSDTSAASRTGSYAIAWEFIQRSPLVGRGYSTFLPSYWILDNQFLGLVIEAGILGLAAYLLLLTVGFFTAFTPARKCDDLQLRLVGVSIAAGIASTALCNAFYDLLAFPMSAGILFLLLGLAGAYSRLVGRGDVRSNSAAS